MRVVLQKALSMCWTLLDHAIEGRLVSLNILWLKCEIRFDPLPKSCSQVLRLPLISGVVKAAFVPGELRLHSVGGSQGFYQDES